MPFTLLLFIARRRLWSLAALRIGAAAVAVVLTGAALLRQDALQQRYVLTVLVDGSLPGRVVEVNIIAHQRSYSTGESPVPLPGRQETIRFVLPPGLYSVNAAIPVGGPGEFAEAVQQVRLNRDLTVPAWPATGGVR